MHLLSFSASSQTYGTVKQVGGTATPVTGGHGFLRTLSALTSPTKQGTSFVVSRIHVKLSKDRKLLVYRGNSNCEHRNYRRN